MNKSENIVNKRVKAENEGNLAHFSNETEQLKSEKESLRLLTIDF